MRVRIGYRAWRVDPLARLRGLAARARARARHRQRRALRLDGRDRARLHRARRAAVVLGRRTRAGGRRRSPRSASARGVRARDRPLVRLRPGRARLGRARRNAAHAARLGASVAPRRQRRLPRSQLAAAQLRRRGSRAGSSQSLPDSNGLVTVDIDARLSGRVRGQLRLALRVRPTDAGGVSMTSSGVAFEAQRADRRSTREASSPSTGRASSPTSARRAAGPCAWRSRSRSTRAAARSAARSRERARERGRGRRAAGPAEGGRCRACSPGIHAREPALARRAPRPARAASRRSLAPGAGADRARRASGLRGPRRRLVSDGRRSSARVAAQRRRPVVVRQRARGGAGEREGQGAPAPRSPSSCSTAPSPPPPRSAPARRSSPSARTPSPSGARSRGDRRARAHAPIDAGVDSRSRPCSGGFVSGEETALVHFLNGGPAKPTARPPLPFRARGRRRPDPRPERRDRGAARADRPLRPRLVPRARNAATSRDRCS